jgi:hypothetical protein
MNGIFGRLCRIGTFCLIAGVAPSGCAQGFVPDHVVFPITTFRPDLKALAPISLKFGTGFCLDEDCRFVGTNYHVAKVMGEYIRIKGVFSAHRYLDSGPHDKGSQDLSFADGSGSLRYNPVHDLAIYEMQHPLKQFHGTHFDSDGLENSPEVDMYAFPFRLNPKRGLVRWHGKFMGKTQYGLLAFQYEEGRVRGGASGGIVVDSKSKKIVGILSSIGEGGDRLAFAVPVNELEGFVARTQPYLQAALFPKTVFVSPVAADLYPPYVWPHATGLSARSMDTYEVIKLRFTAEALADSMRNFTATETFSWGRGSQEPEFSDAYETLIVDGEQRWRRGGGKKFYDSVPFPPLDGSIVSGGEWSWLPEMLGADMHVKIHQAPDALLGGRTIHVFQYAASAEDRVCLFRSVVSYGPVTHGASRFYDCHGEAWVDKEGVILRISQAIELTGPWYRWWGVMTYGCLEKDGRRFFIPVTIATQAEHKNIYWCRSLFTDYGMFDVKTRMLVSAR